MGSKEPTGIGYTTGIYTIVAFYGSGNSAFGEEWSFLLVDDCRCLGNYLNEKHSHCVGYVNNSGKQRKGSGILNLWKADEKVIESPLFLGPKSFFLKTYAGQDLCAEPMKAVGYSLYKTAGIKFCPIKTKTDIGKNLLPPKENNRKLFWNYAFRIPFTYLFSGKFFKEFFRHQAKLPGK